MMSSQMVFFFVLFLFKMALTWGSDEPGHINYCPAAFHELWLLWTWEFEYEGAERWFIPGSLPQFVIFPPTLWLLRPQDCLLREVAKNRQLGRLCSLSDHQLEAGRGARGDLHSTLRGKKRKRKAKKKKKAWGGREKGGGKDEGTNEKERKEQTDVKVNNHQG